MSSREQQHQPDDLTPLLEHGRRGVRSEVARMTAAWGSTVIFVPLAGGIDGLSEDGQLPPERVHELEAHAFADEDGRQHVVAFSRAEWLEEFAGRFAAAGAPLRAACLPTPLAVRYFASGSPATLAINPGRAEELVLTGDELADLAAGDAIPLEAYCPPSFSGDVASAGPPSSPPSPALLEAIAGFVESEPGLAACELEEHFVPEQHRRPHLVLVMCLSRAIPGAERDALLARAAELLSPHGDRCFDIAFRSPE